MNINLVEEKTIEYFDIFISETFLSAEFYLLRCISEFETDYYRAGWNSEIQNTPVGDTVTRTEVTPLGLSVRRNKGIIELPYKVKFIPVNYLGNITVTLWSIENQQQEIEQIEDELQQIIQLIQNPN